MTTLLIVDDQPEIRRLIRLSFEPEGFVIVEAANGAEALKLAAEVKPDLILLDVMMPGGMDGFAVCQTLRSDPTMAATRIVMLSARGQTGDQQTGALAGADAYLTKPFSPSRLVEKVRALMQR